MQERKFWLSWANLLHHRGLDEIVVFLLKSSSPIRIVIVNMLFLGKPFLFSSFREDEWSALQLLLEDPNECDSFLNFLSKEVSF